MTWPHWRDWRDDLSPLQHPVAKFLLAAHVEAEMHGPPEALLRVAAERQLLIEHRPYQERLLGPLCFTCVGIDTYRSGVAIHQFFPCNVAVGLAAAWGWEAGT